MKNLGVNMPCPECNKEELKLVGKEWIGFGNPNKEIWVCKNCYYRVKKDSKF